VRALWAVAVKELRQIVRDRRTLMVLLVVPAFFLFLYGYALNFDIRHVSLAVEDRDGSAESRELIAAFERSEYFTVVANLAPGVDAAPLLDRREARAALVIAHDFSERIAAGETAEVQVLVDGDNANTATTVVAYITAVVRDADGVFRSARSWSGRSSDRPVFSVAPVTVASRVWYNPELRSTVFLVPGLIAFIAMITAVISTALSIVREKEHGTMEQVRMAPIPQASFVLGKTLPYLVLSQIGASLIVVAAMVFFHLPMHGDWLSLSVVLAVFLVGALGTGVLISTIADSQQVAFQAAALVAMLPTLILSGFIFPIASMPLGLQYVTTIIPAKYFLIALRSVVLKGLGLSAVIVPVLAMAAYAVVVLGLSAVRMGRR
jgi:ABC-2 type transport system permease protein